MSNEAKEQANKMADFYEAVIDETCKKAKEDGIFTDEEIKQLKDAGKTNIETYKKEKGI